MTPVGKALRRPDATEDVPHAREALVLYEETTGTATLALMHGSSFTGDGGSALRDLANAYGERYLARM